MDVWAPFIGPMVITILVIFGPGFASGVACGLRPGLAALISPIVSVATIAGWAVVLGLVGVRWSVATVLLAVALQVVALGVARALLMRVPAGKGSRHDLHRGRGRWFWSDQGKRLDRVGPAAWVAVGLGLLLWARHMKNILVTPGSISQTPDNIFHLGAVRFIVETGNASSLSMNTIAAGPGFSNFYPAAWHDLASLVVLATGTSIPVASNATLVGAIVCWVLSSVFLVWTIQKHDALNLPVAAVLGASFTAFPIAFIYWGALHPNILGLALFPYVVGALVQLFRVVPEQKLGTMSAVGICVAAVPGIGLAHPNALMSVFLVATPIVADRLLRLSRDADGRDGGPLARVLTTRWTAAWLAVTVLVSVVAWRVVRPVRDQIIGIASTSRQGAVGEAILNGSIGAAPAWLVSVLAVIGLYACIRRRENIWLPVVWAVTVFFWVIVASEPMGDLRIALVGIWYADPFRPAAILPISALPLAVLGLQHVVRVSGVFKKSRGRALNGVVIGVVCLAVVVATQRSAYLNESISRARTAHTMSSDSALLTTDEYALIERVPDHVAPGERIAVDPWNGSALVYALTGRDTTSKHILGWVSPEQSIVSQRLRFADSDPTVCGALREGHIGYVLSFQGGEVRGEDHPYPGFDDLDRAPGFTAVDRQGSAVLYRIDVCQ